MVVIGSVELPLTVDANGVLLNVDECGVVLNVDVSVVITSGVEI